VIRFALHNLLARRVRTLLALGGLAVAIAGVIGLISFAVGLRALMETTAEEVGGIMVLQGKVKSPVFSRLDEATIQRIARVEGVRAVSREVLGPALVAEGRSFLQEGSLQGPLIYLGVDPRERQALLEGGYFTRHLVEGGPVDDLDQAQISTEVAEQYGKTVGSTLNLQGHDFTVCGIHEVKSSLLTRFVLVHIARAREFLSMQPGAVTALYVEALDPAATDALAGRITAEVGDVEARSIAEWAEVYGDLSRRIDLFLAVITSFAVVVGAIGIANTMLMSVTERIGEFGVLRATGWSRGNVLRLVVTESLTLGTLGGVLGILLGVGAGQLITLAVPIAPVFSASLLLAALALAAATGTLGGLYPAWRAATMDPVAAIGFRDL
jgi:putative ABC transport system permease protein